MIKISNIVEEIIKSDDLTKKLASQGLLNISAYARKIQKEVELKTFKEVKLGSIIAAVARYVDKLEDETDSDKREISQISVQTNLEGMTFERTEEISRQIQSIYNRLNPKTKTYLTLTQGINEITIVAERSTAETFRESLKDYEKVYDKKDLVGITVKFDIENLEIPNLIYLLTRRLALRNVNIVEIVSTATELTYVISNKELSIAIEQLQKAI